MSTLIEKAAKISAKRKFDAAYKNGGEDIEALKKFLNNAWDKHKDAFWQHAATNEKPEFEFRIKLPKGLAFAKEDVRDVFLAQVDDFKGANDGAGGVYVMNSDLADEDNGRCTEFLVHIDWRYYHEEHLKELKRERAAELKRKLAPSKKAKKMEVKDEPEEEPKDEPKAEEKGCWNVVVPAKDGKPERLIPVNLAVVRKGSESVTHLSFK
jgi:hypothetical protein